MAASLSGPPFCIRASVSNQAPTSALPSAGLALSVSVETVIRSWISLGIFELSNTIVPVFLTSPSCGFQVTTVFTSGVAKALTMSASEVLTVFTSDSFIPFISSARARR